MPIVIANPSIAQLATWVATYNGQVNKIYSLDTDATTWQEGTGTVQDNGRFSASDGTQWYTSGNSAASDTINLQQSDDGITFVTQNVQGNVGASLADHAAYTTFGGGVWIMTNTTDIIRSTDGGANWSAIAGHASFGNVAKGIAHDGAGNWAICATNGMIQYSADNGLTWSYGSTTGINYDWEGITYNTNDSLFYISNYNTSASFGGIYTSNDGGATAVRVYTTVNRPMDISANDSGVIMASKIAGGIVRKTAGGTWSEFTIPGHTSFQVSAGKGAAEGTWVSVGGTNGAEIAVSTDDGDNWSVMADPVGSHASDLISVGYLNYYA